MALKTMDRLAIPMPARTAQTGLTAQAAAAAAAAPGAAGAAGLLPIGYVAQSENNWCWAACAAMLFTRPGQGSKSQCGIASAHWGLTCCPSPNAPSACDRGAWPYVAYPPQGIATNWIQAPLSAAQVSAELAAGRPVEVCYQWTGSTSTHVALIVGDHGSGTFEVYDPSYGPGSRTFGQIAGAYGLGTWIYSFTF